MNYDSSLRTLDSTCSDLFSQSTCQDLNSTISIELHKSANLINKHISIILKLPTTLLHRSNTW